ncbi:unnamed protein product [Symbiodinium sp. CCMP2592]|nr:unnamed protein product [Symbiodinium sp. CCMP2592]
MPTPPPPAAKVKVSSTPRDGSYLRRQEKFRREEQLAEELATEKKLHEQRLQETKEHYEEKLEEAKKQYDLAAVKNLQLQAKVGASEAEKRYDQRLATAVSNLREQISVEKKAKETEQKTCADLEACNKRYVDANGKFATEHQNWIQRGQNAEAGEKEAKRQATVAKKQLEAEQKKYQELKTQHDALEVLLQKRAAQLNPPSEARASRGRQLLSWMMWMMGPEQESAAPKRKKKG